MAAYTLLEAAEALGITKNTVKYRLKKAPPGLTRRAPDGRIFLDDTGLEWLRKTVKTDSEPLQTSQKTSETDSKPQETDSKPDGTATGNQIEPALLEIVATLKEQLREKDQQIARLQDQAEALTAALQTAQEQARTAQALHAGTIQQGLLEAKEPEPGQEKPTPRPWWRFWG